MVETLTPAGCGGRHRQIAAVAMFTVASIVAAASVGGLLGWVGREIGHQRILLAGAAFIAVLAALREAGILRVAVPDIKRQVPEHWRRTRPLPVWTTGYGAILGSGFGTYQPAATYWTTLGAVTAMGKPLAGAICMGIFGLTRGVMAVAPGSALLGRFASAYTAIRPVNALVLTALALAFAPAIAQAEDWPSQNGTADPSLHMGNLAYTRWTDGTTRVEVRAATGETFQFPDGTKLPSIYGTRLAFQDASGIRIVEWRTGRLLRRITGPVSKPALFRENLVYVRTSTVSKRLQVLQTQLGTVRTIASTSPDTDLGRPAIADKIVTWHQNDGGGHVIYRKAIGSTTRTVVASGRRRYMVRDPAMGWGRTAWIFSDAEVTSVWVRNARGVTRRVATTLGPDFIYTNLTVGQRRILVNRWNLLTGESTIDTIPLVNV
jgi:hypothetical protein